MSSPVPAGAGPCRSVRKSPGCQIVLQDDVIFGSVSSNRAHYEAATDALTHADPGWLAGLVTRRVALDSWTDALDRDAEDVKVIVDLV